MESIQNLSAKIQRMVKNKHFLETNYNRLESYVAISHFSFFLMKGHAIKEMSLVSEYSTVIMLKWYKGKTVSWKFNCIALKGPGFILKC